MVRYCLVETAWGTFTLVMRGERLLQSKLPDEQNVDEYVGRLCSDLGAVEDPSLNPSLREAIQEYFEGVPGIRFPVRLIYDGITDFQRAILRACRAIGYGRTLGYGELAMRAGFPGAARAVGSAMSRNPHPLITPCHRVVAAGNRLGGFSSCSGTDLKRALLELEGSAVLG